MGKLGKDTKDLLIGNDGSEKEPKDFKSELQDAINDGLVKKADGTLMITDRLNVDKSGEKMIKEQEKGVKKIKDNEVYDTIEEELEAEKRKEEKAREKEQKRKEKEAELARKMQEDSEKKTDKKQTEKTKELAEK